MLTVGVLGVVEARRDGEPVPLPAGKTTELLARLAVEPGVPVRVDAILEDLWGEPTARNTLQAKVSQLRKALGRDVVLGVDGAYVLDLDPLRVDARRALGLSAEAQAAARDGDAALALKRAGEGVALFRGEVLAAAGDWAAPHRTRLEETRWTLVETLMAARVDLGAGADVVAELEALVAEQPLREGLWASLVTALYRAGRQGDALAAYDRVRRHLADELGIDPGPELRALEVGVLRQDAILGSGIREPARPGNVGAAPQPLVGRTSELAVIEEADDRLVTLVGPAGVGKTRLATEVALRSSYPGGAWLVRLEAVDGTADLEQVVAESLRVGSGRTALVDRLEGAETLLLLDNCEHVVAEVARLVGGLLARVRRIAVLATSQVPLGLAEEHLVPLAPLPPEDSVALFEQRARHHRPAFAVDGEHAEVVAQVCARLDHLPLAIELAAARVRALPVEDIARRLDDRFALLRDPGSHAPERRRALDAAIGWSYELLFPDDQRVLWALSCFADGASLAALEAVTESLGVPADAFADTVTRLVDRSLVRLDDGPQATPRYRMLDSVRAFSAVRLAESGDEPAARSTHLGWYADRAARCADVVRTAEQPACVAFARDERADLDAAVAWGLAHDPPLAARIGLGMAWTWIVLGDGTAGATRVRAVLDAAGSAERARGGLAAAWLESSAGDLALARADLDGAATLAGTVDDPLLAADVHWHAAFLAIQEGRPDVVLAESASALASYRSGGSDWSVASALLLSAYGSLMVGDVASAQSAAGEAQGILEEVDDAWGQTHAQGILAGIAEAIGRPEEAAVAFAGAADAAERLGFLGQAALHRASWARCLAAAGDATAREAHERALAEAGAVGDGRLAASVRLHLAQLLRMAGEPERALALLRENERWYAAAGGGDLALDNRVELASMADDGAGIADAFEQEHDQPG